MSATTAPRAGARGRRTRRLRALAVGALAAAAGLVAIVAVLALRADERTSPPRLADYWSGRARLVLEHKWTSASLGAPEGGAAAGAHLEIVGDTWYLFNRRSTSAGCAGRGPDVKQLGTQVRASTDRGATWSRPVPILTPTAGTPWSCAATDGDAVYDPGTQTWRYLFQCLGAAQEWNGCYAERHASSPLGPFTAPRPDPNPVVTPGLLWSRICAEPADTCARGPGAPPLADEGTFNIFAFDGEGWWVGFHGYDGRRGYRGIARTTDFRRDGWQVNGVGGTPTDAVIRPSDALGWREDWRGDGPVGAGAASIVAQDGWYYQLAEMPDENLACTPGQTWDLGLFRTRSLAATSWEQFPAGNPIVYSSRRTDPQGESEPCNVQYPGLVEDPETGVTYVMYGQISRDPATDGIYLYRLAWNDNLLRNGDFWRADADGWQTFPGTPLQRSVERDAEDSPDGTPFLALSCGSAPCARDASLYQDVPVAPSLAGRSVSFGGRFRAGAGPGRLDVVLLQLDAAGRTVGSSAVSVAARGTYSAVRGRATIDERARTLRFQLFPRDPVTFWADDLFVDRPGA